MLDGWMGGQQAWLTGCGAPGQSLDLPLPEVHCLVDGCSSLMKSKAGKSSVGQLARILVTATGMSANEAHGPILCTLGRVWVRRGGPA